MLRRGGKNTQKNCAKKDLQNPNNHNGVTTHLEPDILECKVKQGFTMNKASGGDGTPGELFQILKDDAVKVLHSICQQIGKTQRWPQELENFTFHSNPKEGQCPKMFKLLHNCINSHASKVMLKILQARFQ